MYVWYIILGEGSPKSNAPQAFYGFQAHKAHLIKESRGKLTSPIVVTIFIKKSMRNLANKAQAHTATQLFYNCLFTLLYTVYPSLHGLIKPNKTW